MIRKILRIIVRIWIRGPRYDAERLKRVRTLYPHG